MPISFADAIFWVGVVSCAIAQVAILRSVLRTRRSRETAGGPAVPRPRFAVEVAWAIVPAIALAWLLVATWRTMHPGSSAHARAHVVALADDVPASHRSFPSPLPTPGSGIQ